MAGVLLCGVSGGPRTEGVVSDGPPSCNPGRPGLVKFGGEAARRGVVEYRWLGQRGVWARECFREGPRGCREG